MSSKENDYQCPEKLIAVSLEDRVLGSNDKTHHCIVHRMIIAWYIIVLNNIHPEARSIIHKISLHI